MIGSRTIALALALLLTAAAPPARGQADESAVRAAFIYNFAAFTAWPDARMRTSQEFLLCVHSRVRPDLQARLRQLDGKLVQGRPTRILTTAAVGDASRCHLLVLGVDGLDTEPAMRAALAGGGTLTVCECNAAPGTVGIRLVRDGARLAFSIDRAVVERSGLQISSKLLRLARTKP